MIRRVPPLWMTEWWLPELRTCVVHFRTSLGVSNCYYISLWALFIRRMENCRLATSLFTLKASGWSRLCGWRWCLMSRCYRSLYRVSRKRVASGKLCYFGRIRKYVKTEKLMCMVMSNLTVNHRIHLYCLSVYEVSDFGARCDRSISLVSEPSCLEHRCVDKVSITVFS